MDEKPAEKRKEKKESEKMAVELSQEERYMMGEEDDYEENSLRFPEDERIRRSGCRGIFAGSSR